MVLSSWPTSICSHHAQALHTGNSVKHSPGMQIHEQVHQLYFAPTSTMLVNRFLARRFAAKSMEEQLWRVLLQICSEDLFCRMAR